MSTKLDIPVLSGILNASNVNVWLNLCQDSFEVHVAVNSSTLKPSIQVVLAGIKMEAPAAKSWWNENREELKALTTWEDFVKKVKDHFVLENWKMDALAQFYGISQGSSSFMDYAARLQEACNTLSSGGTGFTISDSVFKNHLLFFSHPILALCMRFIPSFDYPKTRVDGLIALMSSTWDSMVAERVIRPPLSTTLLNIPKPPRHLFCSLNVSAVPSNKLVDVTIAEKPLSRLGGSSTALVTVQGMRLTVWLLHLLDLLQQFLERTKTALSRMGIS